MKKISAAEQRLIENATLLGASQIIFNKLQEISIVNYQLGELIVMSSGESLTTSQMDDSFPYPVYGGGGLAGYYSRYLFENSKIVIGRVGARCGCVFVTKCKAWVTDNALVITKISNLVDDGYLVHALRYLNLHKEANQSAQPVISQKNINSLLIPVPSIEIQKSIDNFLNVVEHRQQGNKSEILPSLPSPLCAIRRIVARIEELAAKVEEARGLRRQSIEEAEGVFLSVLSKFTGGSQAPFQLLGNLCLQITDGEHKTPPRIPFAGITLATAKNVRDGHLDLSFTDFVDSDTAEKCWRRCQPQHEDILMVCVGATTGRVCRLENPPPIVIVRSVAMLRPNKSIIESRFLEYALESSSCQQQIWSSVKQTAQPGLYINRMKQLLISVPPLPEQRRIVAYLDNIQAKVDVLKRLQAETAAELDALLPSILDKAFKGQL